MMVAVGTAGAVVAAGAWFDPGLPWLAAVAGIACESLRLCLRVIARDRIVA